MRLSTRIDGQLCDGGAAARVQERLRWAFGSYATEIRSVVFRARTESDATTATLTVRLRGRGPVDLSAEARTLDEVLEFLAGRARATVSRRLAAERLGTR